MADYDAERGRIEAVYEKWRDVLGLTSWDISRIYHDGVYVCGDGSSSEGAMASTSARWEYQRGSIDFNIALTESLDDQRLEYVVLHECMHILLNEMRSLCIEGHDIAIKHEERVCTMLAWAFMRSTR